jgi:hypothetical protein
MWYVNSMVSLSKLISATCQLVRVVPSSQNWIETEEIYARRLPNLPYPTGTLQCRTFLHKI